MNSKIYLKNQSKGERIKWYTESITFVEIRSHCKIAEDHMLLAARPSYNLDAFMEDALLIAMSIMYNN